MSVHETLERMTKSVEDALSLAGDLVQDEDEKHPLWTESIMWDGLGCQSVAYVLEHGETDFLVTIYGADPKVMVLRKVIKDQLRKDGFDVTDIQLVFDY